MRKSVISSSLNKEQKEAVTYDKGPLLIVAGAGTGKTFVVAEKVQYLIKNKGMKPDEILALTFTDKAAREMEERIDKTLPYGYFQMWISTFHSFADQILRENISSIGLSPGYKLLTSAETIIFLRNNLFLFELSYFRPLGNPHKFLEALLQHFSRLKDEDISPEEYLAWAQSTKGEEREKNLELARAYVQYQKLKVKHGYFDFSDLIYYLLVLFRRRPNILKKYQRHFRHVLVDEFQDTNIAQYNLIKLLCPPATKPNLTVVGDDSQAIYKFRGASVSNILMFMKEYARAHHITLRRNYRSKQPILDAAYRLIKHNDPDTLEAKLKISKNLVSQRTFANDTRGGKPVEFFHADRVEEEALYVAATIAKLKKEYSYSDFAILARAHTHTYPFLRALSQKGIPYQFLGPGMLFKQPEVKDLVAYLNVLADIDDSVSFYRVLQMDIFEINETDIARLLSFSKKISRSLFHAVEIYLSLTNKALYNEEYKIYKNFLPALSKSTSDKLFMLYELINKHLKRLKKDTAGQILYYFLEQTQYLKNLVAYKTKREERIALNVSKFFDKLKRYENEHEDASVFAAVDFIKMSMEVGESPLAAFDEAGEYDAVNVLTVHSSKGLQFPIVFLINLSSGRFPTYERREPIPIPNELIKEVLPQGDYHVLEERRLFYVALTRAMEKVVLTASHFYTEGKRERKLSPFVVETFGEHTVAEQAEKKQKQSSILEYEKNKEVQSEKALLLNTFSFSQLDTYDLCPLRYKYQYMLKIPVAKNAAASFGESIHNSLQLFYSDFSKNKKIDLPSLLHLYRDSWIPIGYSSRAHETKMKKEGETLLKNYFKTFHSAGIKILDLEKPFKIKLHSNLFITGKMDRVDTTRDGGIEIIDYKTGKKPEDRKLENSLQLSMYLLAATDKGIYNKAPGKVTLTFHFLQGGEKVSLQKTSSDLVETRTKIEETVSKIRASNFEAHVGPWCNFCPFRMICEAWQ